MTEQIYQGAPWSRKQIIIAIIMVLTGSLNTLSTKWADQMQSINSAGELEHFNHPFFQADGMFLGEMTCMVAFVVMRHMERKKRRGREELSASTGEASPFPVLIFYAPAFCDMLATSVMYVGLTLTYASSFQMLRGAVIVFTGLLSVAFVGRKLKAYHWFGIAFVIMGLVIVGLSDFFADAGNATEYTTNGIITGDLLIILAQVIVASQFVIEEKFINKYNVPPLQVVGWEGTFGFMTLTVLLFGFYFIPAGSFSGNPRGVLEDAIDAFVQLSNNGLLVLAVLGNISSIAFFNFAGISVTKELSATTRSVLDSVRTLVIWLFSLAVGWQEFYYLQPIGFAVLMVGMFLYNDVLIMPFIRKHRVSAKSSPVVNESDARDKSIEASQGYTNEVEA